MSVDSIAKELEERYDEIAADSDLKRLPLIKLKQLINQLNQLNVYEKDKQNNLIPAKKMKKIIIKIEDLINKAIQESIKYEEFLKDDLCDQYMDWP